MSSFTLILFRLKCATLTSVGFVTFFHLLKPGKTPVLKKGNTPSCQLWTKKKQTFLNNPQFLNPTSLSHFGKKTSSELILHRVAEGSMTSS